MTARAEGAVRWSTGSPLYPLAGKRVLVVAAGTLVGVALLRRLAAEGCEVVALAPGTLDLSRQAEVEAWMAENRPQAVLVAAASAEGEHGTQAAAERLYERLATETIVIESARRVGAERLLFVAPSGVYPPRAPAPLREGGLMAAPPEPAVRWQAVAAIAGLRLCQAYRRQWGCDFVAAVASETYGPGEGSESFVGGRPAALLAALHRAKAEGRSRVALGEAAARRHELLFADDLADGLVFLITRYSGEGVVNVGAGTDISMGELAQSCARAVGFEGRIEFAAAGPGDRAPGRILDVAAMTAAGWRARTTLDEGLRRTYAWVREGAGPGA